MIQLHYQSFHNIAFRVITTHNMLKRGYYMATNWIHKNGDGIVQVNLTANFVRDLPLTELGQAFYFDTKTQGFGVRVGVTKKAYFAESRVRGRKRRVTLGSANQLTLDTARKLAKKAIAEMAAGLDPNAEKAKVKVEGTTLSGAAKAFFEGRDLRPKTQYDYQGVLKRDFADWLDTPIKSITPNDVVKRFDRITTVSGKASANLAVRVFRAIWNYTRSATADDNGYPILPECPANRITALKKMHKPVRRQEYVTDYQAFFDALMRVPSVNFRVFLEILLRTGARRSEISKLRWRDVDFKNKTFTFRDTKNHTDHTLPMSAQIESLFNRLLAGQQEGLESRAYIWGPSPIGDPRKSLAAFRREYGEPLRYHDLRRSFSVITEECDISESKIKALLNHKSKTVTDGYLVSNNPERLRNEMNQINNKFDELSKRYTT